MHARCTKCKKIFNTHDGGKCCVHCDTVACPDHEEDLFATDNVCKNCYDPRPMRCTMPGCGQQFDAALGGRICIACGNIACPDCVKSQFIGNSNVCIPCQMYTVSVEIPEGANAEALLTFLAECGVAELTIMPASIDLEFGMITFIRLTKEQADNIIASATGADFKFGRSKGA